MKRILDTRVLMVLMSSFVGLRRSKSVSVYSRLKSTGAPKRAFEKDIGSLE